VNLLKKIPWPLTVSLGAIGGILVLWLLSWALITRHLGNPSEAGTFGDMFGAVNALFSGLAFAGIILAILMQREELKLQRKELTQSTETQQAQERALLIAAQLDANLALLQDNNSNTIANELEQEPSKRTAFFTDFRKELVLEINNLRLELQELSQRNH